MKRKILDTNVLIHADGNRSPQTPAACIEKCRFLLFTCITSSFQIVIDVGAHGSDVLAEYRANLSDGGYMDVFMRWLLNHLADERYVLNIPLTRRDTNDYEEFPNDPALNKFDPKDRKWIALAVAHYQYEDETAPVAQSADMKWREFVEAFSRHHVEIEFLCDET